MSFLSNRMRAKAEEARAMGGRGPKSQGLQPQGRFKWPTVYRGKGEDWEI